MISRNIQNLFKGSIFGLIITAYSLSVLQFLGAA